MITKEQERRLRRLNDRLHRWVRPYTVKMLLVPAHNELPGEVSLTADSFPHFSRLVGLVKRIVPEFKGALLEQGMGWHYGDMTPYYYSEFTYFLEK